MFSIYRRLPKVNSLVGSARPAKPRHPFGAGILPAYEDGGFHYGSLGLPAPVPVDPPIHQASQAERDYEQAYQAVTGQRAEWLTSRPSVPDGVYFDEPSELPESLWHEPEAVGDVYWSEELGHLASLLTHATPARRAEIETRIDGVCGMLGLPAREPKPRTGEPSLDDRLWWAMECEREAAESLERQWQASREMDMMESALTHGRFDGRGWEEQELCRIGGAS